jgi:hypothetical protein
VSYQAAAATGTGSEPGQGRPDQTGIIFIAAQATPTRQPALTRSIPMLKDRDSPRTSPLPSDHCGAACAHRGRNAKPLAGEQAFKGRHLAALDNIKQILSFPKGHLELDCVPGRFPVTISALPLLKGTLVVDFIRYATGLVIFLGTSFVLMFSIHLFVLWHTKRKNAALQGSEQ